MDKYEKYTLADFLEDDSFVRWAINAEPETSVFWKELILAYPEKEAIMIQAVEFITAYRSQDTFTNDMARQRLWDRIEAEVKSQKVTPIRTGRSVPLYMKVAASIAVLMMCSAVVYYLLISDRRIHVQTASNEVTKVILPDHSVVTLNGNSTLHYDNNWAPGSIREVWIEGEAFFNVKHLNKDTLDIRENERFLVHCSDIDIEVLGTSFNVRRQANKTDVTLITGKVKVRPADDKIGASSNMIMLPGDYAEFTGRNLVAKKKLTKPEQATRWINQEFVFTDAQLKDIVKTLVEQYGYTVDVEDDKLLNMKIEGEISVSGIPELLATVSATLELNIEQKSEKHIVLSRK